MDFAKLSSLSSATGAIVTPSRFPDTYRDIAMLVSEETQASAIVDCIKGTRIDKLRSVEIFDLYTGEKIPAGQKSIAVRVRYGSFDATLTDEEVNRFHQKILSTLTTKLGISQR